MLLGGLFSAILFLETIKCQSLIFQDSSGTTNSIFNTIPAIITPGLI